MAAKNASRFLKTLLLTFLTRPIDQRSLIYRKAWFPQWDKQTRKHADGHCDSMKESVCVIPWVLDGDK